MSRTRFQYVFAAICLALGFATLGCAPEKAEETPQAKAQYQAPTESMRNSYGAGGRRTPQTGGAPAGQPAPPGPGAPR